MKNSAFSVESETGKEKVDYALYRPEDNKIKLYLDGDFYNKKLNVQSENLFTIRDESYKINESVYSHIEGKAKENDISITGVDIYQNNKPIFTLVDRVNVQMVITVANTMGEDAKNRVITITDKNGSVICTRNIIIPEYSSEEIKIFFPGYLFKSNEINIELN